MYDPLARDRAARELGQRPGSDRWWWAVIREDLIANELGIKEIRTRLEQFDDDHSQRLCHLTDLRILDILAWKMGRGDL